MTDSLACLVLAAGKGTRMKSQLPKLLHTACGRPLLEWSLAAARTASEMVEGSIATGPV